MRAAKNLLAVAVVASGLAGTAPLASARASADDACRALSALAATVNRGDAPVIVNLSNSEMLADPLQFSSCWPGDNGPVSAFCTTTLDAVGMHGLARYSERIAACAKAQGARPRTHALPKEV